MRVESRWHQVEGLGLHARASTTLAPVGRLPLVLVHGLGMSGRYMLPLLHCLAPHVNVHAPDLPGFGLSEAPRRPLDVRGMAAALAAWVRAAGLGRAAFLGNSLGCEVLVEFALRHPNLAERLVLQGPTPDSAHASTLRQVAAFLAIAPFERPSIAWVAATDYLRAGPRRWLRTFRHMARYEMAERLSGLEMPVLVVRGARDFLVPASWAESVARLAPQGRLVTVPGAAHGMNYSHPQELTAAVLPFLLEGGASPPAVGSNAALALQHPGDQPE